MGRYSGCDMRWYIHVHMEGGMGRYSECDMRWYIHVHMEGGMGGVEGEKACPHLNQLQFQIESRLAQTIFNLNEQRPHVQAQMLDLNSPHKIAKQ